MLALLFTAVLAYLVYLWIGMRPRNFPPGPLHFPLVGSAPFLPRTHLHLTMRDWRWKYGHVVGLLLGSKLAITVCCPNLVRELLQRPEFQARPISEGLKARTFGKRLGIMFTDGIPWQEQRRFTIKHLKYLGFGKIKMESIILEEISDLIDDIRDQRMQVSGLFNVSSVNVLWYFVAGRRYKRSDPKLQKLMETLRRFFRSGNTTGSSLRTIFPKLRYILPESEQMTAIKLLNAFFLEIIKEHEAAFDSKNLKDFIDVYIMEIQKEKERVLPTNSYSVEGLIAICSDLFSAGAESVGNTLGFAILYMVLHPEIQIKVHEAIDNHLGRSRKPCLQDRTRLPYVEAVLSEIMRCNPIQPVTIPHRVTEDTRLGGYDIPKNTIVLPSMWCVLQDHKHWRDAEKFDPSRFLDGDGNLLKDETFIPFGVGKRVCPGETLARNTLFLFFTSLMQHFTVYLPHGPPKPSTQCLSGFTSAPQPFEVLFETR